MDIILNRTKGDKFIWIIVILLSVFSMLAVYSSTGTIAYRYHGGNTLYYFSKHFFILLFGFFLMFVAHKVNYKYYSRIAQVLFYITIPLLIITMFAGVEINDARRWLTLPIIDMSFQTSDLAKLALIMNLARDLSKKQKTIKDFRTGFLPVMLPPLIICGLIMPSNLSTAAILFATCLLLMFIGRISLKYMAITLGSALVLGAIIVFLAMHTSFHARVDTWISRVQDFKGHNKGTYQVQQAKIAISGGGFFGKGPGNSSQRNFLPDPFSDFIYAIICEEYGLFGGAILIFLYLMLLLRSIRIFGKTPNAFGAFLAVGLSFSLVIQAMINMAVVVNLLPVTGVTLPFVSMGGTSIWFSSFAMGIILSVSANVEQEEQQVKETNDEVDEAVAEG